MRVLFIGRRDRDAKFGGLAEFLNYLPLALNSLNVQSFMYSRAESHEPNRLSEATLLPNKMPYYSGPMLQPKWFPNKKELQPIIELCKKEKIDVIHAQGTYRPGFVALHVYKELGIPYVITSHADILSTNYQRMNRFSVRYRCKKILKNAAVITHLTPRMAEVSHQLHDTQEKSVIIGNGIDMGGWNHYHAMPEKNYMLAIGRLEPGKGFHILIDAFAALQKRGHKTSLVIAGTGTAEKDLQLQAKKHGMNVVTDFQDLNHMPEKSVIFTGYIRGTKKKELFAQAQMVLFATQPSGWEEAFSIVQLETMAAGKAMLASDTDTTRYLQTIGLQTHLVKHDNIEEWAVRMASLLIDTTKRKDLGNKNLEAARKFDWKVIAQQYYDVYRRASAS